MRLSTPGTRFHPLVAFLTITTALTSPGFAQDGDSSVTALETIVVKDAGAQGNPDGPDNGFVAKSTATATKTATDIDRVPQSISVVTRDQMDVQGIETVGEALRYTPGIRSEAYGVDTRYDWYFIRGFSSQAQGLYLDGLQLHSQSFANFRVDPFGLERQEVLLGPNSSLYGAGSPGGLVNLISKRPQDDTFTRLSVSAGSPLSGDVTVDVNGALNDSGTILARFTALGRLGETQVDHVDDNHLFLAPSITFKPNEDTQLTILAKFQKDEAGTSTSFLPFGATVEQASFGRIPTDFFTGDTDLDSYKRDQFMLGYEFDHAFDNGIKFSQNTRYSYVSTDYETIYGLGLASSFIPSLPDTLLLRQAMATDQSVGIFQTDNHLEGDLDTGPIGHHLLAGVDYSYEDFDNRQGTSNGPGNSYYPLDILNPVYGINPDRPAYTTDATTTTQKLGLYLQDQISVTDRFDVTAGLRQDWVSSSLKNHMTGTKTDTFDTALTGRVGASYEVLPGLRPYVSYGTSFDPVSGTDANGRAFEPETATQYEIGAKYQDPDGRFRVTAALFDLTRGNVLTRDPNSPTYNIQTGEVRSRGLELQGQASLAKGWNLLASYTNFDLEITKSNRGDEGKVPVGVPQQMASLWLDHSFDDRLEGLRVGGGVRYVGKSYADSANTLTVPNFVVADAGVGYKYGNAEFSLNVGNVFDKKYVAACAGENSCYYGERRTFTARLSYEW
ncbi:TonB-dependent siderophore receptor [Roseibium algae]|uniref:TonB-dependent siderophore receptor n=1 Tax=Roseibium algae TaxID=3123038 RepID=A0ABU8TJG2_9HYPH